MPSPDIDLSALPHPGRLKAEATTILSKIGPSFVQPPLALPRVGIGRALAEEHGRRSRLPATRRDLHASHCRSDGGPAEVGMHEILS